MKYWEKKRNQVVQSVELLIVGVESYNWDYFPFYLIHICSGAHIIPC